MSLSAIVVGQKPSLKDESSVRQTVTITRKPGDWAGETCVLFGTTLDPNGAIVAGARISIFDRRTKSATETESNFDGQFRVSGLLPATYDIEIESPGLKKFSLEAITLAAKETVKLEVLFEIGKVHLGAVMVFEPLIDTPVKRVINEELILRRPIQ